MGKEAENSKRQITAGNRSRTTADDVIRLAKPSKRRRIAADLPANDGAPKNKSHEHESMDINPPKEPFILANTPKESIASTNHPPIVSLKPSNGIAISSASCSSPYVPMAPPTSEQVVNLLFQSKKTSNNAEKTTPKPPPPTPMPTPTETESTPDLATLVISYSPAPGQRLLQRAIPLLYLVIMIQISCGFIVGPNPLHALLREARSTLPSRGTLKNLIPAFLKTHRQACRLIPHVILPLHVDGTEPRDTVLSNITLRDFLLEPEGFYLALAPAFFGIFAYVGAFTAWDEHMTEMKHIKAVAGASAGAMAAVMLASRIEPQASAELGNNMTLQKFADPPGLGGVFKGDKFEAIMEEFFLSQKPNSSTLMEDSVIPVAVTAFDLKTLQGRILSRGSMAKAARASATFPFLFQPFRYEGGILIDGGVTDTLGLHGLAAFNPETPKRIVNMAVGGGFYPAHGPKEMPKGVIAKEILSLSILNTPRCGPWAMANGPRAIKAARKAMLASMDLPLYYGKERGHYELHIDARYFVE